MNILLAFSPFLVYVVLQRTVGVEPALLAAAATSLLLLAKDVLIARKTPKVLEVGTVLLFGALAAYGSVAGPDLPVAEVRLAVDAGLLLIVLVSLAIGQPFTLQYARETVPAQFWNQPDFRRTNQVITAVWAAAFAVMVAVDLAWFMLPDLSPHVVVIVTVIALTGAVKFTAWYPGRQRSGIA